MLLSDLAFGAGDGGRRGAFWELQAAVISMQLLSGFPKLLNKFRMDETNGKQKDHLRCNAHYGRIRTVPFPFSGGFRFGAEMGSHPKIGRGVTRPQIFMEPKRGGIQQDVWGPQFLFRCAHLEGLLTITDFFGTDWIGIPLEVSNGWRAPSQLRVGGGRNGGCGPVVCFGGPHTREAGHTVA